MNTLTHKGDGLAIFTGKPAFAEKLHVGCPNIGNHEALHEKLNEILRRRWLTNNGEYVQALEARLADLTGAKHCIAMCNATVALEIAIRALDLFGEVIIPAFTFVATAHSLKWQEINPVFCDIDPRNHTIDAEQVERLITPRTTGIIGVHLWGRPCAIEALTRIAQKHRLKLLFDAAHAFGCSHKGRMIGSFGDAEVFSFHATKFFNTFEGGAVMTNSDELAAKIRLMRNFGFADYDNVTFVGTNGKMSEFSAAAGLTNIEDVHVFACVNERNYRLYHNGLRGLPGIRLLGYDEGDRRNFQYIVLEIDAAKAGLSRDEILKVLWAENVIARRYFYPGCHRMEPYRSCLPDVRFRLPVTERVCQQVLVLPTGTAVDRAHVTTICGLLREAVENADSVRAQLQNGSSAS